MKNHASYMHMHAYTMKKNQNSAVVVGEMPTAKRVVLL